MVYSQDVPKLSIDGEKVQEEEEEELDPEEPFNFKIWSQEPPEVQDPFSLSGGELPVVIEPAEAVASRLHVVLVLFWRDQAPVSELAVERYQSTEPPASP